MIRNQPDLTNYLSSGMLGVASHLEHRFGAGSVEQVIAEPFVAESQCREFMEKDEDDEKVPDLTSTSRRIFSPRMFTYYSPAGALFR
jgi:hypothetical protein